MRDKIAYRYKEPMKYWEVLKDIPEPTEEGDSDLTVYVVMADQLPWTTMTIIYDVYKHYPDARKRIDKEILFNDHLVGRILDYTDLGLRAGDRYQVDGFDDSGRRVRYRIKKCYAV